MIDKIVEAVLRDVVRRVEEIEDKLIRIPIPNKDGFFDPVIEKKPKPIPRNLATSGQIWKVKKEGGTPWEGMTKSEATKEIDRLLKEKENGMLNEGAEIMNPIEIPEVKEPKEVDTEDAGLDAEDLM